MGEEDETTDLPSFNQHMRFCCCGPGFSYSSGNPASLLRGRNSSWSCQSDNSPDPDYFDHSTQSCNVRIIHPRHQYLDDHAYQWVVARLLRARILGCLPYSAHGVFGELGFQVGLTKGMDKYCPCLLLFISLLFN